MALVSVVVPCYNYGRYLPEAIESIQAQSVDDLEILAIDNGSTDDTQEVLASFDDPRLRVYALSPNRGLSVAVNVGLEHARGDYVAYLDADDRWRPSYLARQLEILESEPEVGVVFCNFVRFSDQGLLPGDQFDFYPGLKEIPAVASRGGKGRRIAADAFSSLVDFYDPPAWLQSMVFRRSVLDGVRLDPELWISQDLHFALRVYHRTQVAFNPEPLVEVRRHGDNLTGPTAEVQRAKVQALQAVEEEPLTEEQRLALRRRVGRAWIEWGNSVLAQGSVLEAAGAFSRAAQYHGNGPRALKNLAFIPLRYRRSRSGAGR